MDTVEINVFKNLTGMLLLSAKSVLREYFQILYSIHAPYKNLQHSTTVS